MYRLTVALVLALALPGCLAFAPGGPPTSESPSQAAPVPTPPVVVAPPPDEPVPPEEPVPAPPAEEPPGPSQDFEGAWLLPYGSPYGCYGNVIAVPPVEEGRGIWYDRVDVDPATWGAPLTVEFRWGPAPWLTMPYVGLIFYDADGDWVGWVSAYTPGHVAHSTVPPGAVVGYFCACEAVGPFSVVYQAG